MDPRISRSLLLLLDPRRLPANRDLSHHRAELDAGDHLTQRHYHIDHWGRCCPPLFLHSQIHHVQSTGTCNQQRCYEDGHEVVLAWRESSWGCDFHCSTCWFQDENCSNGNSHCMFWELLLLGQKRAISVVQESHTWIISQFIILNRYSSMFPSNHPTQMGGS